MNVPVPTDLVPDLGALAGSAVLLVAYHLYIAHRVRLDPNFTLQAVMNLARTAWTRSVMAAGKDILAVQTLRNSTMAATFLASTAILMIIGILTLSGQGDKLGMTWGEVAGLPRPELRLLKLLLLLVDLFAAFFSFAMSVRLFNHVGYMINVPLAMGHRPIAPDRVAHQLNRAGRFYSLGMRAYYVLVPLVLWLFGPALMLTGTMALLYVLYRIDHVPPVPESAPLAEDIPLPSDMVRLR